MPTVIRESMRYKHIHGRVETEHLVVVAHVHTSGKLTPQNPVFY